MLPVKRAREAEGQATPAESPRQESWHATGVVSKPSEVLAEKGFFGTDDRNVDQSEQHGDGRRNPDVTRSDRKTNRDDDRAEVKRIAAVGIGTGRCQLLVLLHMTGSHRSEKYPPH